ncbi:hypothetical protein ACLKA6_010459 [Drosophila palustris]
MMNEILTDEEDTDGKEDYDSVDDDDCEAQCGSISDTFINDCLNSTDALINKMNMSILDVFETTATSIGAADENSPAPSAPVGSIASGGSQANIFCLKETNVIVSLLLISNSRIMDRLVLQVVLLWAI